MNVRATGLNRYGMTPFFLVALFFIAAAPTFWHLVEIQQAELSEASENTDLYQEVYPILHYGGERLRVGEFPLWNDQQWAGTAFLANPTYGVFQPLHGWAFLMPMERALPIHSFISLVFMALFFVLFGRSLGVGYIPATIGALTYTFCGASAAAMSRPGMAAVLVWSPLLLWAIREWARLRRYSLAVLAGLSGGLILVSASPAMAVAMFALAIPYVFWASTFIGNRRQDGAPGRALAVIGALAVAGVVGAAQWVPAVSWMLDGAHSLKHLWNARASAQIPGTGSDLLMQILAASPGALPRIGYVGTLPLLLAPVAVFHHRARRDAWFFLFMGLILVGLVFIAPWGEASFHFPWWVAAYPVVLTAGVLTALGADRLIPLRTHTQVLSVAPPVVLVALVLGGLFFVAGAQIRGYLIAFIVLTLPALCFRRSWMVRGVWIGWAVLLFADLTAASVNTYLHPFQDGAARRVRLNELANLARDHVGEGRVFVSAQSGDVALPKNIGLLTGLRVVNGTGAGYRREHASWWYRMPNHEGDDIIEEDPSLQGLGLLRYAAVRVILVGRDAPLSQAEWEEALPGLRVVGGDALTSVLVDDEALPWATWYTEWEVHPDVGEAVDRMLDPGFPMGSRCILGETPNLPGAEPGLVVSGEDGEDPGGGGTREAEITIRRREPEEIVVEIGAPSPGVLVLADQYEAGWRAEANGETVPIMRANGIFRGIPLEAGEHEIRFEYAPRPVQAGIWISVVGLSLLVIAGGIGVARGLSR